MRRLKRTNNVTNQTDRLKQKSQAKSKPSVVSISRNKKQQNCDKGNRGCDLVIMLYDNEH